MSIDTLERHRQVWDRKPSLRRVYTRYFQDVLDCCNPLGPTVELGSGPGFLKRFCPDIIATDVVATPWADRVVNACELPFDTATVGNLVMIDVFHHIEKPRCFLEEAARVLRPGGRLVMLEPWTSPLGYLFYRYVHHEDADLRIDAEHPFPNAKDPFDGNAALPMLFFAPSARDNRPCLLPTTLDMITIKRIPAFDWLLTGGFQDYDPLPQRLGFIADMVEFGARMIRKLVALRALIVLERRPAECSE